MNFRRPKSEVKLAGWLVGWLDDDVYECLREGRFSVADCDVHDMRVRERKVIDISIGGSWLRSVILVCIVI